MASVRGLPTLLPLVAAARAPGKVVLALLALAGLGAAAPPPRRIVSMSLCADQLLIALADRGQVAGLTEWARDPSLSFYADQARRFPFTHRGAEEVLALRPDLVIDPPPRVRALLRPETAVRMLPRADDPSGIEAGIMTVAAATGHARRGAALVRAMTSALARIGPPPGRGRVAAYYQRAGYLTGSGTLVDDMMRRVGLVNLAGVIGRPVLARLSLEELVLARPAFLIGDGEATRAGDRGSMLLRHPLLDRAVPPARRLVVPQALTVCGGPFYPRAVALLAAQIRRGDIDR